MSDTPEAQAPSSRMVNHDVPPPLRPLVEMLGVTIWNVMSSAIMLAPPELAVPIMVATAQRALMHWLAAHTRGETNPLMLATKSAEVAWVQVQAEIADAAGRQPPPN